MNIEDRVVLLMIQGYSASCVLYSACELNIFDILYNTKMTRKELSEKVNGDSETLNILIDALIVNGLLEENKNMIECTNAGKRLAGQEEGSLKDLAIFTGRECMPAWLKISDAIKNHSYPFKELNQGDFFKDIKDSDRSESFVKMMGSVSRNIDLSAYLKNYNPNKKIKIVDIGGGSGEIISKFLEYFTNAKGLIMDLGHVKDKAESKLKEENLIDRCDFKEGSFFESYDVDADIFILSRILHDWGNKECESILNNIKKNMNYNSRLLIIEKVMPDVVEKKNAALFNMALHIWAICGGRERNQNQYNELIKSSGMTVEKRYCLDDGNYVLEVKLEEEWEEGVL